MNIKKFKSKKYYAKILNNVYFKKLFEHCV